MLLWLAQKRSFWGSRNRYGCWTSLVSIVKDKYADPNLAADLIAQAEHDINAQSILITTKNLIRLVNISLKQQLKKLPKKYIASKSLKNLD